MILVFLNNIFVLFYAFFITLFLIFLLKPISKKLRFVDIPNQRKMHEGNISLIGGICIFFGVILSTLPYVIDNNILVTILIGSFFIMLLGFIDDCHPLSPILKILVQLIIVFIIIISTNLKFETFGHSFGLSNQIQLGIFSYPITILGVIFVINAFNLMDGADGVAGSLALLAVVGINIVKVVFIDFKLDILSLALSGSLLIFIWFNLKIKTDNKIFLGDSGSLLLGYFIAFLLLYQTKSNDKFSPTMSFWMIAIPIYDVLTVIIYRLKKSKSIFRPDRSHLHYFLQNIGLSNFSILFSIISLGILIFSLGLVVEYYAQTVSFLLFSFLLIIFVWLRVFSRLSKFNID